ncbi:MAG TPA: histidine ammonia-lyase [Planctomycetota bacterium]|nr:histidine ammonia-lyase [Planctomycetota bacterium]
MPTILLGERPLPLVTLITLSRPGARIGLSQKVRAKIAKSRAVVTKGVAKGAALYGINTGFGKLAGVRIPDEQLGQLQRNLLLSHATGVGDPLPQEQSRLAFALRIHNLALGFSGVRIETLEQAMALWNGGFLPVIPAQGSVGASGDLAPLSHMALPLIGCGEVHAGDEVISGAEALRRLGREPLELACKEGLALVNGTQVMTAIGCLALHRAILLAKVADIACAMTVEALRGSEKPFQARLHELRPHPGQQATAANLCALLANSKIMPSHANCTKVQDAYSMRCAPQVHGASKDGIRYALDVLVTEANSVTDNPLVFPGGDVVSGGNFHGQPVSQAMDFLKIAVSTLANISERRIEQMVNPDISGLPPFLARNPGLESGFMIAQVVAASLASENKTLAHPASVDTVPTSANREDHVSMGVTAARHAGLVVANTAKVLGIEVLCAAQALDLGEPLRPGVGVAAAVAALRKRIAGLDGDRQLAPDLAEAERLVLDGSLVEAVEQKVGVLAV